MSAQRLDPASTIKDLEQRVAERTRELQALLDVAQTISSTLELGPLLGLISGHVGQLVGSPGAGVLLLEEQELVLAASQVFAQEVGRRLPLVAGNLFADVVNNRQRVITPDIRAETEAARRYRAATQRCVESLPPHISTSMMVPMIVHDKVIGVLAVVHPVVDHFTAHHGDVLAAVANQAAVAIENARLLERSRELAVLEERQRLARELHDSVAQAFFGIGLAADTGLTWLERDPARVGESLRYVGELSDTGMAELRALLFALRPESLDQAGLVGAISTQAVALRARYRLAIELELCPEPTASPAIKEALHRIAQEALHNAVKHASPSAIHVRLEVVDDALQLEVADDGVGFDTSASFPGHLGLQTMPERAARLGGTVEVRSAPGAGTTVVARIPAASP